VLHRPEYRQRARTLRQKLRRAPFSPRELLVRWVEFAARFPDLPELNLPTPKEVGGHLVYHSVDVLGVLVAVLLVALGLVYAVVRRLLLLEMPSDGKKLKQS
jgi:hypothetical protein